MKIRIYRKFLFVFRREFQSLWSYVTTDAPPGQLELADMHYEVIESTIKLTNVKLELFEHETKI